MEKFKPLLSMYVYLYNFIRINTYTYKYIIICTVIHDKHLLTACNREEPHYYVPITNFDGFVTNQVNVMYISTVM